MSTTAATLLPTGTWKVDPTHSSAGFSVKHMGIATVRGRFAGFEGELKVSDGGSITARGEADVSTIDTGNAQRDEHLRSGDFFGADEHPHVTYEVTEVEPVDEETFKVVGDLTIRGITAPVELVAVVEGTDVDPWDNERVAITATGSLRRSDYGLTWNQALGSGNVLVGEKVNLAIDISAVRAA